MTIDKLAELVLLLFAINAIATTIGAMLVYEGIERLIKNDKP